MFLDPTRYWPPAETTWLLAAALHPDPDAARAAWRAWDDPGRFDATNWAQLRVFPIVARRLPELGLDSTLLPRLIGVRRFLWTKSRILHRSVTPLLKLLLDAGIPLVLTKGAARIALDPAEALERYSHDVDALVPEADWDRAASLLMDAGMTPEKLTRAEVLNIRQRYHGIGLQLAEANIDLHLHAMKRNRCLGDDDGLRARAVPGVFAGLPVHVPGAEDRLVMAIGHGLLHSPGRPTDWAFDAAAALATPGFDWGLVEREVVRRGLSAFGVSALRYLRQELAQPVPEAVIAALEADVTPVFAEELECLHHAFFARTVRESVILSLADMERARRAAALRPPAPPSGTPGGAWEAAETRLVGRRGEEAAALAVPGWIAPGDRVRLDLRFEAPPPQRRERVQVELSCFEAHPTLLHQQVATSSKGQWQAVFHLPGDFLALRQPAMLLARASHLTPGGRAKGIALTAGRGRWTRI